MIRKQNSLLLLLTLALAMVSAANARGGNKGYMGYQEESVEAIQAVDQLKGGKITQCVNWAKKSSSELIKKLTHNSGLHLFTKKYPACPINHKEHMRRARKSENGVLLTSKDSLEMCQIIGKLMEMGRLPPDVAGIESSNLLLLNVGAATSRASDMNVAHWLGFESYNYEWDTKEYTNMLADWKTSLAESPRTHVVKSMVGHIQGGTGTVMIELPKKKKQKKADNIEVDAVSLDYAMKSLGKTVAFIHIDVADQEYEVLKGAYGVLQKDKPALFFQHSANLAGGAGSRALCLIKNLGYDCGFIDHTKSANVVCTHPEQYHYKATFEKGKKKRGKKGEKKEEPAAEEKAAEEKAAKKGRKRGKPAAEEKAAKRRLRK